MRVMLMLFAVLYSLAGQGQICIGRTAPGSAVYSQARSAAYIMQLKKSTTIFVLQEKDYDHLAEYESVIKDVWTYTPYKIVKPEEVMDYKGKDGYTFFSPGVYYTGKHSTTQHLTYDLWVPRVNKKGKVRGPYFYSRTLLYPEQYKGGYSKGNYRYNNNVYDMGNVRHLAKGFDFYNWNVAMFKGYLLTINTYLTENRTRNIGTEWTADDLAMLRTDTLYIPGYARVKPLLFTNRSYVDSALNDSVIRRSYPYPVQFVSNARLSELLADYSRNIYYMVYVRDAAEKYIDIFSSQKGLVYARFREMSWTFKRKDMARVAKAVAL